MEALRHELQGLDGWHSTFYSSRRGYFVAMWPPGPTLGSQFTEIVRRHIPGAMPSDKGPESERVEVRVYRLNAPVLEMEASEVELVG